MIYRILLPIDDEQYPITSGATYPGCQRIDNPDACDPASFESLDYAVMYALERNETPILVSSIAEVDGILAGTIPVTEDMILAKPSPIGGLISSITTPVILGIVLLGTFLLGRKRKT